MKYNCRYCKKELDTVLSILRCPVCKADVNESIEIADRQYQEEQRELRADAERRIGYVVNDRRGNREPCPVCGRPTGGCCTVMVRK